jgi:hypothetical protein
MKGSAQSNNPATGNPYLTGRANVPPLMMKLAIPVPAPRLSPASAARGARSRYASFTLKKASGEKIEHRNAEISPGED